jgi:arylsulfatase A-like enzyme
MKLLAIIIGLTLTLAAAPASEESPPVSNRAGTAPAGKKEAAVAESAFIPPGQSASLEVQGFEFSASKPPKPNIVIVLVDDMGYGDPHCFNPRSKIATPNIDRLAREGMRFTDAHAPGPLCHPSRYGLMTGCYPFRTDITLWPKQPLIREGQMTIASVVKTAGYRTAMVGKWHLGFREEGYDQPLRGGPVDCGFDSFFGLRASTDIPPYFYIRGDRAVAPPTAHVAEHHSEGWSPTQGAFWREGGIAPGLELKDVLPRLTEEACAVIDTPADKKSGARQPLMLYLAYTAPHTPWLPAAEFAGKSGAGTYGDFVTMVDAQIGRVLAALEKSGRMQDTLLVFTSDNGPVWHPADVARLGHDAVGGLRGMKSDAWEGGHRMPFVVRWPGRVKAGSVSDQTICFTDLLATFADICGVKLPAGAGPDSFSFLPVLEGRQPEGQPIRGPIVMQAGSSPAMMIRSGDWKLINRLGSGGFSKPSSIKPGPGDPAGQLYNFHEDPAETSNLYLKHPEIVSRLEAELRRIVNAKPGR